MNIVITLLLAALAYVLLVAVTGSVIVGIVAAIVVLVGGAGYPAYGRRF